jgi:FKBP-type peptidyl-prolyl cis-trans isomerase SlyD
MKIEQDSVVSLRVEIADESGWATPSQHFTYLHGHGNLFAKVEAALAGLEAGGNASVKLAPADAFGERNPALIVRERRDRLPPDIELGSELHARGRDEEQPVFRVVVLTDAEATLDGNHPLAGRTVEIRCAVLDVREATNEEIEHGHAHGPEGHEPH